MIDLAHLQKQLNLRPTSVNTFPEAKLQAIHCWHQPLAHIDFDKNHEDEHKVPCVVPEVVDAQLAKELTDSPPSNKGRMLLTVEDHHFLY